uniref:Uncharacterized protein n=1 Tax=Peronospora matthiolae TaxID=2874970 RepID=A0AAV1UNR8_9STRA
MDRHVHHTKGDKPFQLGFDIRQIRIRRKDPLFWTRSLVAFTSWFRPDHQQRVDCSQALKARSLS